MRRTITVLCLLVLGVTGAALSPPLSLDTVSKDLPASVPSRLGASQQAPPGARKPQPFDQAALTRSVRAYLAHRPGRAGIMVQDLRTGRSYGAWQSSRFVTASVIKVDILTALLLKRQRDHGGLSGDERELAAETIRVSDNDAADALYAKVGNGPGLSRLNRPLGLKQTVPLTTMWGVSKTTPADQVRLMRTLTNPRSPLSNTNRAYVLGLMSQVIGEQHWGVSAAARPGERVAIKNGWVPLVTYGHGWAINTVGRVTGPHHDFLVAVCSQSEPTMESGVETVEHLAAMVTTTMRQAG